MNLHNDLKWTIWENIEMMDKSNKLQWDQKMRRVAWFDNYISFFQAWKSIPHSEVGKILYNSNEQKDNGFKT